MYHFSRWDLAIELKVGLLTLEGLVCIPIYMACVAKYVLNIESLNT